MDLVWCVLAWLTVGRGLPWQASSSHRGSSPQVLTIVGGAKFIAWRPRRPLRGMPTCLGYGMPGVSGLRPCARTHLKRPCAILVWFMGPKKNTDKCVCTVFECHWAGTHFPQPCWSVHGSCRVCHGSGGSLSRPFNMDSGKPAFMSVAPRPASTSLRGPSSQALTLHREAKFIT